MWMIDSFRSSPLMFTYLTVFITLLFYLIYDFRKIKGSQVDRLINKHIQNDTTKKRFNLMDVSLKVVENYQVKVRLLLDRANVRFTVQEYFYFMTIAMMIGAVVGFVIFPFSLFFKGIVGFLYVPILKEIFGRAIAGALFIYAGMFFPKIWMYSLISKRKKLMEDQIQDSLLNIADALKSSSTVPEAIRITGEEIPFPLGPEYFRTYREMAAGRTLSQALAGLKDRVNLKDFSMAINAIEIQFEVGGELEPLLRNMVRIIQERLELKKEIEKTIAGSKITGYILLAFPIGFVAMFSTMNKTLYLDMVSNGIGIILLMIAVASYAAGAAFIIGIIRSVSKEI
jgi:Flp pilus assembly protein TadB